MIFHLKKRLVIGGYEGDTVTALARL